jgi:hypothetical protein
MDFPPRAFIPSVNACNTILGYTKSMGDEEKEPLKVFDLKALETPPPVADYTEDELSIFDILPAGVRKAYARIPKDIVEMDDDELVEQLNALSATEKNINLSRRKDIELKHSFWHHFDQAVSQKKKIKLDEVLHGIMQKPHFTVQVIDNPYRLAWVLRPPKNYWNNMRVLLDFSTENLYKILEAPIRYRNCRCKYACRCSKLYLEENDGLCKCERKCACPWQYDPKIMELQRKTHEMIEMRVRGAIIQRFLIDKKQLIAQVQTTKDVQKENEDSEQKSLPPSMDALEDELAEVKKRLAEMEQKG